MAYSYVVYPGNGSTTQFAITFPYIRKEHIKVYVNYVDTAYTYVNDTTVQLATAPASPLPVEVRRVTPLSTRLVDYTDGSTLVAADLDTSSLQSLYNEQELKDALENLQALCHNCHAVKTRKFKNHKNIWQRKKRNRCFKKGNHRYFFK